MAEKIYPRVPSAPEDSDGQSNYNATTINSQLDELQKMRKKFEKKYKRYKKVTNRINMISLSSNFVTTASGLGALATGVTIVGLPVSATLGAIAIGGSFITVGASVLSARYDKKMTKVMNQLALITTTLAIFERGISRALADDKIDSTEFESLQNSYYETLDKISQTDKKMEAEARAQFEKGMMIELVNLKKRLIQTRD